MKIEDIIKFKLKERGITQSELARLTGFKGQTNIGGLLNNQKTGMRIVNAVKLLDALGCDVVVVDRADGNRWTVGNQ